MNKSLLAYISLYSCSSQCSADFLLVTRRTVWKNSQIPAFMAKRLGKKQKSKPPHFYTILITAAVFFGNCRCNLWQVKTPLDLGSKSF